MKLIDFHTHIYPEKIAEKAVKSVADFYSIEAKSGGTAEDLLAQAQVAGVQRCVILPVAINPVGVRHINEFTAEQARLHPEFIPFGTLHAGSAGLLDEAQQILDLGLYGVKMHPDTQLFNIDDERLYPVYDMLQGRLPFIFHSGDPRYDYSHPRRIKKILHDFPQLVCIAAHFGGWRMQDEAYELLHGEENCYYDISSSLSYLPREKAIGFIRGYGAEKFLFGSDFPVGLPSIEKENLLSFKLTDNETDQIAYKNACNIINLAKTGKKK